MILKPVDTVWLVSNPSFKAGYSLNPLGEVFVHVEGNPHDYRLAFYVSKQNDQFFEKLSRATGQGTAFAAVKISDKNMNRLVRMAGMTFYGVHHGYNIFYRLM